MCADILPRGYSPCHHSNCDRPFKMVIRNKYSEEHRYKQRFCKIEESTNDETADSFIHANEHVALATSEAVMIGNVVATMSPGNITPRVIMKHGPTTKATRRARELDRQRRRHVKVS